MKLLPAVAGSNGVVIIQLTKGLAASIDAIDADFAEYKWAANKDGYATRTCAPYVNRRGKTKFLHRLIMERILDRPLEKGERVDHKDLNPQNNCRSNLRLATRSQ